MSGVVRIAVEDDEALFATVENVIFFVLLLPGGSAKETTRLFLAQNELLSPRRPELFQLELPKISYHLASIAIYNNKIIFQDYFPSHFPQSELLQV